jgi:hypothetical protein
MTIPARAGDKIEFSEPGVAVAVPKPDTAETVLSDDMFSAKVRTPEQRVNYNDMPVSSGFIVITSGGKKDAWGFDSASVNDRNNGSTSYQADDTSNFRQRAGKSPVKREDSQSAWEQDSKGSIFDKGDGSDRRGDSLRDRMESHDTLAKAANWTGGYYDKRDEGAASFRRGFGRELWSDKATGHGVSDWARSFFHIGSTTLDRAMDKDATAGYTRTKETGKQADPWASVSSPANAQSRDTTSATGEDAYGSSLDNANHKSQGDNMNLQHSYRTFEPKQAGSVSESPARPSSPASPKGYVRSRPAILPYPKKPGDLFK